MNTIEVASTQAASTMRRRRGEVSRPNSRGHGSLAIMPRLHGSTKGCATVSRADIETPLVLQRMSDIDVVRRRLRILLATRGAHRLFNTTRWLTPEARRFLVHR